MVKYVNASRNDRDYFGQEMAELWGDKIQKYCKGMNISKRIDLAEQPGGVIYEAERIGISDFYDLIEALEGMCHDGRAVEVDDSTYRVR